MIDITLFFYILSAAFFINGIVMTVRTNATVGLAILYGLSVFCFVLGRYRNELWQITSNGFLFYLRCLFLIGCCIFGGLMIFIMSQSRTNVTYDEDVVIILGAGVKNGKVSSALQNRLDAGIEYYKQNPDCFLVVTGGLTPQKDTTEAAAMKNYLLEHNIPEQSIVVEDKSQSTLENYIFSGQILDSKGIRYDNIVFITNDFHIYRARKYAEHCGFENAKALATGTDIFTITPALTREVLAVIDMWVFKLR